METTQEILAKFVREIVKNPMERQQLVVEYAKLFEVKKSDSDNRSLRVSLEFDESRPTVAWLQPTEQFTDIPNQERYFIAPAANYDKQSGKWNILGYSFVHVSHLPTAESHLMKLREVEALGHI
jgi:hypothetical protein